MAKAFAKIAALFLLLAPAPSFAQPQLPPEPGSACPVTHDCRPVAHGMQTPPPTSTPPKTVTCPPGTIHLPGTPRCKVIATGQ